MNYTQIIKSKTKKNYQKTKPMKKRNQQFQKKIYH